MYGVIVKAKYALEAVVHDIVGPGLRGIIRPRDVIICDILFMRTCVISIFLRKLEIGLQTS